MIDNKLGVIERIEFPDPPPVVTIIDGRSGSGKTCLALSLAEELEATVLHMDDLYRGWEGLSEAPALLEQALRAGRYQRFDWNRGALGDTRTIDPTRPLIIEGCGSLTARTLAAARDFAHHIVGTSTPGPETLVYAVWLECPEDVRMRRALGRDGDMFRPHWDSWAKQEAALIAAEQPSQHATVVVNTETLTA